MSKKILIDGAMIILICLVLFVLLFITTYVTLLNGYVKSAGQLYYYRTSIFLGISYGLFIPFLIDVLDKWRVKKFGY